MNQPWLCGGVIVLCMAAPSYPGNVLDNSSFETGINSWGFGSRHLGVAWTEAFLDDTVAFHGRRSLKTWSAPFVRGADHAIPIQSKCCRLEKGKPHSVSAYVRFEVAGSVTLTVHNQLYYRVKKYQRAFQSFRCEPGEWQRVSFSFTPTCEPAPFYSVTLNFQSKQKAQVWVDAVQIETGELGAYEPKAPIEAGIGFAHHAAILVDGEDESKADLVLVNHGTGPSQVEADCVVYDLFDRAVLSRKLQAAVPAGANARVALDLKGLPRGPFRLVVTLPNGYVEEKTFSVLPPRKDIPAERSYAAAYVSFVPEAFDALGKAGFHWTQTLSVASYFLRWPSVEPEKGKYVWHDERMAMAAKHGFRVIGNIEGLKRYGLPKWTPKTGKGEPDMADYRRYVREVVSHYKPVIKHWLVQDEAPPNGWSPELFAKYFKAAAEEIRAVDPGAKIAINANPGYIEKIVKLIGPQFVDILTTNHIHSIPAMKRLADYGRTIGKPAWCCGVGWSVRTFYRTYPHRHGGVEPRECVRRLLTHQIGHVAAGVKRIVHYDARYLQKIPSDANGKPLFEFDGSLTATAVAYAAFYHLLDGATPVGVATRSLLRGLKANLFRTFEGGYLLAITPDEIRGTFSVRFPVDPKGLAFLDGFANPFEPREEEGGFEVVFNEQPFYIRGPEAKLAAIAKALGRTELSYVTLPHGREKKRFRCGRFGLILNERNYAVLLDGRDIVPREGYFAAEPLRSYNCDQHERQITETDAAVVVRSTFRRKTMNVELVRVLTLRRDRLAIEWTVASHDPVRSPVFINLLLANDLIEDREILVEEVLPGRKVKAQRFHAPKKHGPWPSLSVDKVGDFEGDHKPGIKLYHLPADKGRIILAADRAWWYDARYPPRVGFSTNANITKGNTIERRIEIIDPEAGRIP